MNRLVNFFETNNTLRDTIKAPAIRRATSCTALTVLAICVLLALPACKHKESSTSNENTAGVPATPQSQRHGQCEEYHAQSNERVDQHTL